jgi:hypothetical protein
MNADSEIEYDVKDDFAERLGHGIDNDRNDARSESRFQRLVFQSNSNSWGVAPGSK